MPAHMKNLQRLLTSTPGDWFTSSGTSTGELYLFAMLHQIVMCSKGVLDATPALLKFYDRTLMLPGVAKVMTGKSPMGFMAQYFIPANSEAAGTAMASIGPRGIHAELLIASFFACACVVLALLGLKRFRIISKPTRAVREPLMRA